MESLVEGLALPSGGGSFSGRGGSRRLYALRTGDIIVTWNGDVIGRARGVASACSETAGALTLTEFAPCPSGSTRA